MPLVHQPGERRGAVRRRDLASIDRRHAGDRVEPASGHRDRLAGRLRHDLHRNAARQHRACGTSVGPEVGSLAGLRGIVVPDDPPDSVRRRRIGQVGQASERHENHRLLLSGERAEDQFPCTGEPERIGQGSAPDDPFAVRPPRRGRQSCPAARADRNALVVELRQQRRSPPGGRERLQGTLGGGDGKHLRLAVAQQHADRPQVVRGAVGVDDQMEARLTRMGAQPRRGTAAPRRRDQSQEEFHSVFRVLEIPAAAVRNADPHRPRPWPGASGIRG